MLRAHCKRTYIHTHTFMFVNKRIFPIAAWLLLLPIVWRLQLKIPTFVHFSIAIVIGRLLTTTTTTLNFFQCMLCIRIIFWQWETPRYISFFDAQKHSWLLVYFRITLCEVGYFSSCNNIFNLWVLKVRIFIMTFSSVFISKFSYCVEKYFKIDQSWYILQQKSYHCLIHIILLLNDGFSLQK